MASFIPLTPVESLPLKTLTSDTANLIAFPFEEFNNTSSLSEHILTPIRFVFSGSFIAIFPFDCTFVKSESALRRTLPVDVAKKICKSSQVSSGASTGIIAATDLPEFMGRILIIAFPLAFLPPIGRRQVFIL